MKDYTSFAAIIFSGICILVIMVLKKRAGFLLSFLTRMIVGMGSIYFINEFLSAWQINLMVGWNPISLLTSGSLGFGGVALLYAIAACKFL